MNLANKGSGSGGMGTLQSACSHAALGAPAAVGAAEDKEHVEPPH